MCAELTDLPPAPAHVAPGFASTALPSGIESTEHALPNLAAPSFAEARDRFDALMADLEPASLSVAEKEAVFRDAMAAYDSMLAAAHLHGEVAHAQLRARYPKLRAVMAELRAPLVQPN